MKKELFSILKAVISYGVLSIAIFLMVSMTLLYSGFDTKVGFLSQKQQYISNEIWLSVFYVHVFSAFFCLFAGFTQFSSVILANRRNIHRTIGKLYAYVVFLNFPVGLVMAYYANGFMISKTAFFLLDCLWFWFTLKAVMEAKKGNYSLHKNYMIRSYALTLSAITLRLWKLILSQTTNLDSTTLYMIDAWLGFVPNLLLAEIIIQRGWLTLKSKLGNEQH